MCEDLYPFPRLRTSCYHFIPLKVAIVIARLSEEQMGSCKYISSLGASHNIWLQ